MNSLITLLTIAPLLVHSLKCYEGHAGAVLKVEQKSLEKKTYMCLFEPKNPCTFDKPDEYNTYKYNPQYADKCITSDRAICFCTKDLCNGDYKVLMEHWNKAPHGNATVRDCVKRHFENLMKQQVVYKQGTKAPIAMERSEEPEPEEPPEEGDGSTPGGHTGTGKVLTGAATEDGHTGAADEHSGGTPKEEDGSGHSDAGDRGTTAAGAPGEGGTDASQGGTDHSGASDAATTTEDPIGAAHERSKAQAANQDTNDKSNAKGKEKAAGYNWLLFTILAAIAGTLVFIVIPVLLIMIVAKYSKTKAASKGNSRKKGHGKGKNRTSKSKGPRSKSSKGTKSKSKSMQSKSIQSKSQ